MPAKSTTKDRQSDQGLHSVLQSSIYSQPWWRGVGNSHTFDENMTKPSAAAHLSGSLRNNGAIQSQESSALNGGPNSNKDAQITIASQSDGDDGQETHLIQVPSSTPVTMVGHLEANPQMELVGHSIVLTSYPYSDAQYGGVLPSYVPQAMVPPQLCGMHHARMALPLEMEEEPVYVNAKQFNGILRRRQARAKAELERKVIKVRKPYLHESRHQHAMRRARGCGGRFLSSKKSEDNSTKPASDKDANSCTNLSRQSTILLGSDWLQKNATRSLDSSKGSRQEGKESTGQGLQSHSSSHTKNGHGLSSVCDTSSGDWMERGFSYQQRLANGAIPHQSLHHGLAKLDA